MMAASASYDVTVFSGVIGGPPPSESEEVRIETHTAAATIQDIRGYLTCRSSSDQWSLENGA
jgi:hypothetical protein